MMASCTEMACSHGERQTRSIVPVPSKPLKKKIVARKTVCKPRTRWSKSCNKCYCTGKGVAVCSLKPCTREKMNYMIKMTSRFRRQIQTNKPVPQPSSPPLPQDKKAGTPTTTNEAIASPTVANPTTVPSTTKAYNPRGTADRVVTEAELKDSNFKCTPSLSFKVDCNTCWCAANGKETRFCTRIACKPNPLPPLSKQ